MLWLIEAHYIFEGAKLLASVFIVLAHEWDRLAAHQRIFEGGPSLLPQEWSFIIEHHVWLDLFAGEEHLLHYSWL